MLELDAIGKGLQEAEQNIALVQDNISKAIVKHQAELEKHQKQAEFYRVAIKDYMASEGIKKFENEYLSLTFVEPSSRTIFDSKRFKEEEPDTYAQYTKTSTIAGSLRIKVKEPSDQLTLVEQASEEDDSI